MGIQDVSRDLGRIHVPLVNLATRVNNGTTTLEQAAQILEGMTQQMPAESRAAAIGLLSNLIAARTHGSKAYIK